MLYLSFKWLHIISIISWMAGILYLIRLLVNHAEQGHLAAIDSFLQGMEERLYRIITRPAMIASWLAGLGMIYLNPSLLSSKWLLFKLAAVLVLTATTLYTSSLVRLFAHKDGPLPSGRALRLLNELPTLLMMIIVALVVFKPF